MSKVGRIELQLSFFLSKLTFLQRFPIMRQSNWICIIKIVCTKPIATEYKNIKHYDANHWGR
jgi:hypothetical protein